MVDFPLQLHCPYGLLEGFTPGEVTILLNEPIDEQRMVSVRLNSFTFEGHTLYCRPKQNQFEAHVSIDDIEENGLRRAPRFPVNLPAQLFLSQAEPLAITIIDISSARAGNRVARAGGGWATGSCGQRIGFCLRDHSTLSSTFRGGVSGRSRNAPSFATEH